MNQQGTHQRHGAGGTAICVESELIAIQGDAVVVTAHRSSYGIQNLDLHDVAARRGVGEYGQQQETHLEGDNFTDTHHTNSSKYCGCKLSHPRFAEMILEAASPNPVHCDPLVRPRATGFPGGDLGGQTRLWPHRPSGVRRFCSQRDQSAPTIFSYLARHPASPFWAR